MSHIKKKIEEYNLFSYTFYVYVFPFMKLDETRKDIIKKITRARMIEWLANDVLQDGYFITLNNKAAKLLASNLYKVLGILKKIGEIKNEKRSHGTNMF